MTAGTTIPAAPPPLTSANSTTVSFRAMATDVIVTAVATGEAARARVAQAREVFARVEAACTRFDPASPLMRANAAPEQWHVVPRECFEAVEAARQAHLDTGGLFDPRILETLLRLGYDASLRFTGPTSPSAIPVRTADRADVTEPWQPELDADRSAVRLGRHPIDLGGIGKGLAVRWAARQLAGPASPTSSRPAATSASAATARTARAGRSGSRTRRRVAVDPELIAVLRLADTSCATSSVRVRTWRVDGRPVHHLIDPRTGDCSSSGLRAVTVVGADPAWAEVWSKALFLVGRDGIARACREHDLAAYWVSETGDVGHSDTLSPLITWRRDDDR